MIILHLFFRYQNLISCFLFLTRAQNGENWNESHQAVEGSASNDDDAASAQAAAVAAAAIMAGEEVSVSRYYESSDGSETGGDTSVVTPGHLDVTNSSSVNNSTFVIDEATNTSGAVAVDFGSNVCDDDDDVHIGSERLLEIRVAILKRLFSKIEKVEEVGGEHAIPYFQV